MSKLKNSVFALILAGLAALLVPSASAVSYVGYGNFIDSTSYCGSGVCTIFTTNHKAVPGANATRGLYGWSIYMHLNGGSVGPVNSFCRPSWKAHKANFYTGNGQTFTIPGDWWYRIDSICASGRPCDNYRNDFTVSAPAISLTANFNSFTYWGTRCMPAASAARTTRFTMAW
jgi:hypothetical protein